MSGSLLKAEVHRFRSRRFIVLLLLLGLGAFLAIVAISATQFAKPSAQGLADARAKVAQLVVEQERNRQQCLSIVPVGENPDNYCGTQLDATSFPADQFLDKHPFELANAADAGAIAVAAGTAAMLFLIGATWVGAEWSSKSMVALLFWEPRRIKVIVTKLGVLLVSAAVVAGLSQALWLLAAKLLAATRGTTEVPPDFYGDLLALQGRGVVLGVLAAAFGFALANLVRNTGAALGIGFVYFAVLENAVRILRPGWQQGLLSNNAAGLMAEGGLRYYVNGSYVDDKGFLQEGRQMVLSNLQGGLVLGCTAAAVVAVGVVLFARRDLQ